MITINQKFFYVKITKWHRFIRILIFSLRRGILTSHRFVIKWSWWSVLLFRLDIILVFFFLSRCHRIECEQGNDMMRYKIFEFNLLKFFSRFWDRQIVLSLDSDRDFFIIFGWTRTDTIHSQKVQDRLHTISPLFEIKIISRFSSYMSSKLC